MPTKVKKRPRTASYELGKWELKYLMDGMRFFPIDWSEPRIKALWDRYKHYILAYYTEGQHYEGEINGIKIVLKMIKPGPGKRPWAWWKWEAKEGVQPAAKQCERVCGSLYFDPNNEYVKAKSCSCYEKEVGYLQRLGLLTEKEKELLNL